MDKNDLYVCTDEEYQRYEALRKANDKVICSAINRFYHRHRAVYHSFYTNDESTKRRIYPIITSDKSEEKILSLLDLMAPPGQVIL